MKLLSFTLLTLLLSSTTLSASSNSLTVLRISKDKRAIEVQRYGDLKTIRIDVLAKCGVPEIGDPEIRWFEQRHDMVQVVYGKHCSAKVLLRNLVTVCSGCD